MAGATKGRVAHSKLVLSASQALRVRNVGAGTNHTATVGAGTYFNRADLSGLGVAGQLDALYVLATALNAAGSGLTWSVTMLHTEVAAQGKPVITASGACSLLWTDAITTMDGAGNFGEFLGFDTSADDTGASAYTSDNQAVGLWYPRREGKDLGTRAVRSRGVSFAVGGAHDVLTTGTWSRRNLIWEAIGRERVLEEYAATNEAFETLWEDFCNGGDVLYYPDNTDQATRYRGVLESTADEIGLEDFAQSMGINIERYRCTLPLRLFVSGV